MYVYTEIAKPNSYRSQFMLPDVDTSISPIVHELCCHFDKHWLVPFLFSVFQCFYIYKIQYTFTYSYICVSLFVHGFFPWFLSHSMAISKISTHKFCSWDSCECVVSRFCPKFIKSSMWIKRDCKEYEISIATRCKWLFIFRSNGCVSMECLKLLCWRAEKHTYTFIIAKKMCHISSVRFVCTCFFAFATF